MVVPLRVLTADEQPLGQQEHDPVFAVSIVLRRRGLRCKHHQRRGDERDPKPNRHECHPQTASLLA